MDENRIQEAVEAYHWEMATEPEEGHAPLLMFRLSREERTEAFSRLRGLGVDV